MFKRKKKKTGCQTLRLESKSVLTAQDCGVDIVNYANRVYQLNHGDVFVLNDVAIDQTFHLSIKDIKLGEKMNQHFICTKKIRRRHWWQFWKPKYRGARFMYVEKENNNDA